MDIFCGSTEAFERIKHVLTTQTVAARFDTPDHLLKRFDIQSLNVVKISVRRPSVQGTISDGDMHGAGWAARVAEMQIEG